MSEYLKLKTYFKILLSVIFVLFLGVTFSISTKSDHKKQKLEELSLFMLPNLALATDANYIRLRELEDKYSSFGEAIGTISIFASSFAYKRREDGK